MFQFVLSMFASVISGSFCPLVPWLWIHQHFKWEPTERVLLNPNFPGPFPTLEALPGQTPPPHGCAWVRVCACECVCVCVRVHVCVYIYIYTHTLSHSLTHSLTHSLSLPLSLSLSLSLMSKPMKEPEPILSLAPLFQQKPKRKRPALRGSGPAHVAALPQEVAELVAMVFLKAGSRGFGCRASGV